VSVASDPTYLSIVAWPEGTTYDQQVDLVATGTGIDHATLRLRMRQEPPFIVAGIDREPAARTVQGIRRSGGDALCVTKSEIESLGGTVKVRDMRITTSGVELDIWRSDTVRLDPARIEVLVTAGIATQTSERREASFRSSAVGSFAGGMMIGGVGMGMSLGAADVIDDALTGGGGYEKRTTRSYKLDVHARDANGQPIVYQIDGDKFAFGILGDMKGHSDHANMAKMVELFQPLAPRAIVDHYFALFKPPTGHHRVRLPDMSRNQDDLAFAFYSRWVTLVYRYLAR